MRTHAVVAPTKTFGCVCGKFFATYRGLSKHWDYEPGHRPSNLPRKHPLPPPAPSTPAPSDPPTSRSEPTSPLVPDASPLQSPTSTPSSPVYFKSLGRNPSYVSIIRTRQSSNTDQGVESVKVGSKRQRGAVGPPAKAMQLNTGEKVSAGDSPESKDGSEGILHGKKKSSGRPRTRSLSGSDNTPPPSMRGSLSAADLVRSPMTRSSSAAMKTVEFVSLPSRKKRRRRTGTGESQLEESPTSEEVTTPTASSIKKMKVEEHPEPKIKAEERPELKTKTEKPKKVQEPLPPQQQPVKRKRGRPPKHRKDPPPPAPVTSTPSSSTPSTSATSTALAMTSQQTIVTSTTSSLGSITSPSVGREPPMEAKPPIQPMEETPLPSSSLEGNLPSERPTLNLPLWDSIRDKSQLPPAKSENLSPQLQALLSQHPDPKSQGSELPELPFVHPSIIPPTSTSCPPVIPSILPQLKFNSEHPTSLSAALPTQPSTDAVMSPPSNMQYTYVVSSKESKTVTVKSTPSMAFAGGETTLSDSKVPKKGKSDSKSPKEESDEEPEVIAVEPASSVPIDLTKDDKLEEVQGKRQNLPSKAAQRKVVQREGREKQEDREEEEESTGDDTGKQTETKSADDDKEAAEVKEKERSTVTQRPPSVIVSVLSGSEKGEKKVDEKPTSSSDAMSGKAPETEPEAKKPEARRKLSMSEPSMQIPYSLASTPTYVPSTYPYPGPFPPPPVMFPPPGSPTSSMYPPYYGGYPPPPMPPGPYMHPPPPPMGMMPHPPLLPSQQGSTSQPHTMPSPYTPATSSQLSSITTVGGVRVSVLDKPPMQMPTVTVPPLQMQSPGRSRSSSTTFNTHMDHTSQGSMGSSSVIKSFMSTPSPEGMQHF